MEAKEKYIAFCKEEEYLPIFFQPWYLDGVCPKSEWHAVVSERNGKVAGILAYYQKTKKAYTIISMPPNSRMMGPYVSGEYREQEEYRKIQKVLLKGVSVVDAYYQIFHYAVTDWFNFYVSKFHGKKLYSFILSDFSNLTKSYSSISRNLREKLIPEAKKIVTIKSGLDPKVFYEMLVQSKEELNKKLEFSFEAFKTHYDSLIKNKAGKIYYTTDKKGNVHSAGLLMWDKLSSYFYLTAEPAEFKFSGSLAYLTWSCIEITSKEHKLDFFDFGGNHVESSDNNNHPFGAVLVPFLNISKYDSNNFGPFKSLKKRVKKNKGS